MKTRFIKFWISCFVLAGCGWLEGQITTGTSGVWLMNRSYGSTYTVFLNGEPINWADGAFHTLVRGYPIQQGTNRLTVNLKFSPDPQNGVERKKQIPHSRAEIYLKTQETDAGPLAPSGWDSVDSCNEFTKAEEPFDWESEFEMDNKVANPGFEKLGTTKDLYVNECQALTVKLAKLVQKQDYDQLAKVFGLTNRTNMKSGVPQIMVLEKNIPTGSKAALLDECPGLVYRIPQTNQDLVSGITNASEVAAISGEHLILIHSVLGKHLASFSDIKVVEQASHSGFGKLKHEGIFNIDSFVFGRVGGKWKFTTFNQGWIKNGGGISAYGSGWLDLNLDSLN